MVMRPQDHDRLRLLIRRLETLEAARPKPEEVAILEIARTAVADEITILLGQQNALLARTRAVTERVGVAG